jgi:uncharacterized SAM-binding protein YcdF (DUF218 family)
MSAGELGQEQVAAITAYVDIEVPPPPGEPTAHIIFGTNQAQAAAIVSKRHHRGLAPLAIVTGGINRHNGVIEGRMFRELLMDAAVPDSSIRVEDQSADTWQNVELSLPFLREALAMGLRLTIVSKWYHRRAVHTLRTLLPQADRFYALSWEPVYSGTLVTRDSWPNIPSGKRRVIREWHEVPRRIKDGSYREAAKLEGAWR